MSQGRHAAGVSKKGGIAMASFSLPGPLARDRFRIRPVRGTTVTIDVLLRVDPEFGPQWVGWDTAPWQEAEKEIGKLMVEGVNQPFCD
jgi:hypothetical protein